MASIIIISAPASYLWDHRHHFHCGKTPPSIREDKDGRGRRMNRELRPVLYSLAPIPPLHAVHTKLLFSSIPFSAVWSCCLLLYIHHSKIDTIGPQRDMPVVVTSTGPASSRGSNTTTTTTRGWLRYVMVLASPIHSTIDGIDIAIMGTRFASFPFFLERRNWIFWIIEEAFLLDQSYKQHITISTHF